MLVRLLIIFLTLFVTACIHTARSSKEPVSSFESQKNAMTIMTFNVENLFDAKDDPGKNDSTFLPRDLKQSLAHKKECQKARFKKWQEICLDWDWNDHVVTIKLQRLAESILQVRKGRGPDILILQEVENKEILERLNSDYLKNIFKEVVLIEGKDARGIDVAILSRYELIGKPHLHEIPFQKVKKDQREDSRGILQANFEVPEGEILSVFALHLPAPFHPVEMRMQALDYLNKLLNKLPAGRLAVAGGDFNIPAEESKKTGILEIAKKEWLLAHELSCEGCRGTTYYAKENSWSFLDMILLAKSFKNSKSWKIDTHSLRIPHKAPQQTREGKPWRFNLPELTGVSDHWPLAIDLVPIIQSP